MHGVEVPIDLGAVIEVPVTQEAETMPANLIRRCHDSRRVVGLILPQECGALRNLIGRKEEMRGGAGG